MSKLKKLGTMLLALVFAVGMTCTALAASDYTITISNSVTGKTYTAYKIFDATYNSDSTGTTYYITGNSEWYEDVTGEGSPFTVSTTADSQGRYQVTVANGTSAATIATWIAENLEGKTYATTGTGNGGELVLDVDAPGYYYITTSVGTNVTLDTANPTATVVDKEQTPGGDLEKTADDTTKSIGETVTYTITSNVPAYDGETQITNYTFKDTLSAGLTAPAASAVTVTIKDASGKTVTVDEGVISVTVSGQVITVSYDPTDITGYPADATITITYTATVNAEAAYENGNSVTQIWNGESTGTTDTVTVYTYGFNLNKYAGSVAEGNELTGAEFTLSDNDGAIYFVAVKGGYRVATSADESGATTTISAGTVKIYGLAAGTYTLTETKAPDGYNKLANTVSVTVGEDGSYSTTTGINLTDTDVVNKAGSSLPSTDGMGTTIFYIVGGVMVAGAVVLLITKKRMSE